VTCHSSIGSGAVIIPFPRPGRPNPEDRQFLVRAARLLEELARQSTLDETSLLRLHTAVDLRRPRLRRLLSTLDDSVEALNALEAVSDGLDSGGCDQVIAARQLAMFVATAATSDAYERSGQ
jgi:hypothetical protein